MQGTRTAMAKLIAKAWTDDAYRQQLQDDPAGALRSVGLTVPEGAQIHVHHNTPQDVHVVIPTKPSGSLENVANLAAFYTHQDIKAHYTLQDL